jgi:hypothetical protein
MTMKYDIFKYILSSILQQGFQISDKTPAAIDGQIKFFWSKILGTWLIMIEVITSRFNFKSK